MKPLFIISCPIDTYSGYGARSRDIVKALIKSDKYDVRILPQRWGATSFGFLKADNPEHKQIIDRILPQPQLPKQPDVWMQITVPNEFQPVGKFNIGVTAGIETTVCDPSWIEGLNRMNLNLVSSEHAKQVFENSKFEARNQQTNQVEKLIELKAPVEVLFEGADINIYKKIDIPPKNDLADLLYSIPEQFAFLFVGHWLQGALGEDRKNVGMMIKTFLETFKNVKDKPALILKTQGATASIIDKNDILDKIRQIQKLIGDKDLPNVYLIHGMFDDEEMNALYNHPKVKAHITFTKGEGFGRPLLEASISAKPVVAPNWSGHIDFLKPEYHTLLPGGLTPVDRSAVNDWILKESQWFTVNYQYAAQVFKHIVDNYKDYFEKSRKGVKYLKDNFSIEAMDTKFAEILNKYEARVPETVQIQMPKLNLPKLQKV